ncbi:hypothetical protein [Streptococcus infantis]|uniref:hypothetical protein n=1 Tax=Streptococcus infantis TaxID=68892 RepID=UPI0039C37FC9
MTYRTCKPPSQSVYSGVCHRLALTSKIAIELTMSRPLIYRHIVSLNSYNFKCKLFYLVV